MPSEKPAITEIVIPLYQLYPIALCQAQFILTSRDEVVYNKQDVSWVCIGFAALPCSHGRCLFASGIVSISKSE